MQATTGPYQPDGTLEICDSVSICRRQFYPFRPYACSPKYQECGIIDGPGHKQYPLKPIECMQQGDVCIKDPRTETGREVCVPPAKRCGGKDGSKCAEYSEECVFEKGAAQDALGYCMKMLVKVRD
jgi:hypothetical protein